ncbi:MAG: hypothetical protein PWP23_2843 [Candidatus Sumerlaeota bacterium]|nr:hypothetical protein [Candidatus Sumerlaeota bacterium]
MPGQIEPDVSTSARTAGFRFSLVDGAAVLVCAGATVLLWRPVGPLVLLFPIVLGHFFLFCNIFRVRRFPELVWSAVFLLNMAGWLFLGSFSWWGVLAVQTPLTVFLIGREMTKPWYHGVGARVINRRHLDEYLAGKL